MATRAVKALRFTVAWLLVPAVFAATGYYVIGPRLGTPHAKEPAPSATGEDGPSEDGSTSRNFSAPKIEVSVKKGSTVSQRDIQRPRRKRKPAPKPAEPTVDTPTTEPPTTAPSGGGETVPVGDGL